MVDNVIDYINPSMYDYDADKQKCCDIYVICAIASSLISNQSRLTFPKIQILFFFFLLDSLLANPSAQIVHQLLNAQACIKIQSFY